MPREEDAMRGKDAHMQATKREESSNIPVLPIKKWMVCFGELSPFIFITYWLLINYILLYI